LLANIDIKLAVENAGVFPVTKAYLTIDGAMTSGPHGSGEMPGLGSRYQTSFARAANLDFSTNCILVVFELAGPAPQSLNVKRLDRFRRSAFARLH